MRNFPRQVASSRAPPGCSSLAGGGRGHRDSCGWHICCAGRLCHQCGPQCAERTRRRQFHRRLVPEGQTRPVRRAYRRQRPAAGVSRDHQLGAPGLGCRQIHHSRRRYPGLTRHKIAAVPSISKVLSRSQATAAPRGTHAALGGAAGCSAKAGGWGSGPASRPRTFDIAALSLLWFALRSLPAISVCASIQLGRYDRSQYQYMPQPATRVLQEPRRRGGPCRSGESVASSGTGAARTSAMNWATICSSTHPPRARTSTAA